MTIAFITRGICAAECLKEVYQYAAYGSGYDWSVAVISGLPLVEAKNEAVKIALTEPVDKEGLLLIEDDIIAPPEIWEQLNFIRPPENTVYFAEAIERNGRVNTRYNLANKLLWTGNVFTWISHDVLQRMEKPIFRAWNLRVMKDRGDWVMVDRGPDEKHGHHSDAFFWWSVQKLDNPPEIINIGRVDHIRTPFNSGDTKHQDAFTPEPFKENEYIDKRIIDVIDDVQSK